MTTAKPEANGGKANTSIPMSTYSVVATKSRSKKPFTGTLAGTSPFASTLSGSTIPVVVVPVVVNINGTMFDPTAPNFCGAEVGIPAITRIMESPIVQPSNLTFNGIDVGYVQYVDGFMRAQFWQTTNGNPAYTNAFSFSVAPTMTINAGTNGITYGSGCQLLGVVNTSWVRNQMLALLQSLTGISSSEIVLFVTTNISHTIIVGESALGSRQCAWLSRSDGLGAAGIRGGRLQHHRTSNREKHHRCLSRARRDHE